MSFKVSKKIYSIKQRPFCIFSKVYDLKIGSFILLMQAKDSAFCQSAEKGNETGLRGRKN